MIAVSQARFVELFAALLPFLAPHRRLVVYVLIGLLVDVAFNTLLPLSLKLLIDYAIVPLNRQLLIGSLVGLLISVVIAAGIMIWRDYLYSRLGGAVIAGIRQRLFAHLQSLSLNYFARTRAGDLVARFSTDLAAVETVVVGAIPNVVTALLHGLSLSVAMIWLDLRLAIAVGLMAPICWIGPRLLLPRAATAGDLARQREGDVLATVQENLGTQSAVKALGLESHALQQFKYKLEAFQHHNQRFHFLSYLAERAPNIGMLLIHVGVLAWGSLLCFEREITVGTLVAFNALLLSLSGALATLTSNIPALLHAGAGMRRIREVFVERPAVVVAENALAVPGVRSDIRFDEVHFSYGTQPNLRGVSLTLQRGRSYALVGPSGCGKSTLLGLIARFQDPTQGRVLLDGVDLRQLDPQSLRSHMGMVLQDTELFEASVLENIRLGGLTASDAEVMQAAILAEADGFIRALPQGYHTKLGAAGVRLSGGQRQRIGIARALVRNPELLLLDEATSALDPATERALNLTLARLRRDHTEVVVTHRLAAAQDCDHIFVMDAGRLVEQGTHAQLIAAAGLYAQMWRKQSGLSVSDDLSHATVTAAWLHDLPIFASADAAVLGDIAAEFSVERYRQGHDIVVEGSAGDRFYIIVRGSVAVRAQHTADERVEIAKLCDGDAFGEAALLGDVPRNATVTALTDCVCLVLERERFLRWLERDVAWRQNVVDLAARR